MKTTVFKSINAPYDLHDMNVIELKICGSDLCLYTQSGMVKTSEPFNQICGHVEFKDIDPTLCFVYLLEHNGNVGRFSGEKLTLLDFIKRYPVFGFSVMDTAYGYNLTKYSGYLTSSRRFFECIIEICHKGDILFFEE